jgi:hypothetical protein
MEDRRPILSIRNPGHADSEVVRFANGETFLHSLGRGLPETERRIVGQSRRSTLQPGTSG